MKQEKILVIRYGTIGDTIFASAFYRELRKNLPEATIDVLVDGVAKGVMENCPYIDNIIPIIGKFNKLLDNIKLFRQYDTVYFLKNDSCFSLIAFLAGVKNRIGFKVFRNKFLNFTSPYKEDRNEIDCYLDLLKISGFSVENINTELWINKDDETKIKSLISDIDAKKIIIQACSRMPEKNWLEDYWLEVIKYISNELKAQVLYVGGAKDTEYYNNLSTKLGDVKVPPIDLCGKLKITETMALVKNSELVIGIDSGIIHIAAAADTPSILLHGPTSLKRWSPRSEKCTIISKNFDCSPCLLQAGAKELCKNKIPECMKALEPNLVINALKKMFL